MQINTHTKINSSSFEKLYIPYSTYMCATYILYYDDVTGGSKCSAALSRSLSDIPLPSKF